MLSGWGGTNGKHLLARETMVDRLRLVARKLAVFMPVVSTAPNWRELVEIAYREACLDYCCNPELLADRRGFAIVSSEDATAQLIGNTMHCPDVDDFELHHLTIYRLVARTLLITCGRLFVPEDLDAVTAELVLPRAVAVKVIQQDLPMVNPFVPFEYLRSIFVQHRRSGEMAAVRF